MPKFTVTLGNKTLQLSYQLWGTVSERTAKDRARHYDCLQFSATVCSSPRIEIAYVIIPAFVKSAKKRDTPTDTLIITGKSISFQGRIRGVPEQHLQHWKVGVLQTIYKSERIAHYEGEANRIVRLNTSNGPLADQEGGDAPFACDRVEHIHGTYTICSDDEPNFDMPLYAGPGNAKLQSTSGEDSFCTFLVLVREQDKFIIELSRIIWRISWEGKFSWRDHKDWREENPWLPRDVSAFFQVEPPQVNPQLHMKTKSNRYLTPFSLKTTPAHKFCEVYEGGEWTHKGVPALDTWWST